MKIGILSDTHDRLKRTLRAVQLLQNEGAEALIHCGDLTGVEIVQACALLPTYYVFGNNDFELEHLRQAMLQNHAHCLEFGGEVLLAGKRVAVTHGDRLSEVRRLRQSDPDYLLYGHSHVADDRQDGPTRWINPGALHRAAEKSVALLDLSTDTLRLVRLG